MKNNDFPAKNETSTKGEVENKNAAMIEYLSKEIETMSNNTMQSRSKISFSLWAGPFFLLGTLIVGSEKGGFGLQDPGTTAWIVIGLASLLFFGGIAFIVGHIEHGAWDKCNQWRHCIVDLQLNKEIPEEKFKELVEYKEITQKVTIAYLLVFAISFLMFVAVIYFIAHLMNFSRVAQ